MWRIAVTALVGVLVLGGATSARAQDLDFDGDPEVPERRRFDDEPVSLGIAVGVGTLVGEAGILFEYELDDRLAFGAGIGVNLEGWMGGPYLRLRPWSAWRARAGGCTR